VTCRPDNVPSASGAGTVGAWTGLPLRALALLAGIVSLGACPALAQAQPPVPSAPTTIDGPSPDILGMSGFSVARDGTGAVAYLKNVSGVAHVFVSRLIGGQFQTPEQVDGSLPGPSSQPVIAAGNGGMLLLGFINGGSLWVLTRPSATTPYVPPLDLADGAINPALQMTNFGKAYLAFAVADGAGHDVRAAFYNNGQWALEPTPLNAVAADDAGTGTGRPALGAAGDGVGIVAWGEGGHIYSRRVWGTYPSIVYQQADVGSLGGWSEAPQGADQPSVGVEGDSSYVDIVFHEVLTNGSQLQSRVLMNRLHGSLYDGVTQPDGLSTPSSSGADQPQISEAEYGNGIVTSVRTDTNQLWTTVLGSNGSSQGTYQVDSLQNATAPRGTPGMDGLYSGLVAWQHDSGALGSTEIRARYFGGSSFWPETIVSSPDLGPTDAARGLATGGDISGDGVIAWVQGSASSRRILAVQLYQAPGSFAPLTSFQYVRSAQRVLAWSPARDAWGPIQYSVTLDGAQIAQTPATATVVPFTLSQGPHRWWVTATNPAGLTSTARAASVWVDTVAPVAHFTLTGRTRAGSLLHIYVTYSDSPPPLPAADASGVASVLVNWGDGSRYAIHHGKFHIYRRPGRYLLRVTVTDRAGNATNLTRMIRVAAKPKPKPKRKPHKQSGSSRHTSGGAPTGHR
jgi:hypothetical protein